MEHWPLRHLVLRTPRLELRPDDDDGLDELVEEAYLGVHPPEEMPFGVPWTDADPAYLGRRALQHFWQQRSAVSPQNWEVHLLVRFGRRVIGVQTVRATDLAVTREVRTGSWMGLRYQGQGIGTEMRAAVLMFAFDHLGAVRARSGAFADNVASLRVSAKLGYRRDGSHTMVRRGVRAEEVRLVLSADQFVRPEWKVEVEGVEECLGLLGVG